MTDTSATQQGSKQAADKNAIRPFHVNVPEAELTELRRRIVATRLPEKETVADFSQGVPLATTQKLARYWATEYDWRKVEARLNAVPNFITEIDGLDIHFIHVRSKHENALPVLISHGWPGSIIEQLKLIEPLINPTAFGGTEADAFHGGHATAQGRSEHDEIERGGNHRGDQALPKRPLPARHLEPVDGGDPVAVHALRSPLWTSSTKISSRLDWWVERSL